VCCQLLVFETSCQRRYTTQPVFSLSNRYVSSEGLTKIVPSLGTAHLSAVDCSEGETFRDCTRLFRQDGRKELWLYERKFKYFGQQLAYDYCSISIAVKYLGMVLCDISSMGQFLVSVTCRIGSTGQYLT